QWEPPTTVVSQDRERPARTQRTDGRQPYSRDSQGQREHKSFTRNDGNDKNSSSRPYSRDNKGGAKKPFSRPAPVVFDNPILPETQSKKKKNKNKKNSFEKDIEKGVKFSKNYDYSIDGEVAPRRFKPKKDKSKKTANLTQPIKAEKRKIKIDEFIRVSDIAHQMGIKASEIVKFLFSLDVMVTVNQPIDIDTASIVAAEYNYEVESVGFSEEDILLSHVEDTPESLVRRAPVVTIMGHVDHGKTSLLDAIRRTNVIDKEAGGITQHIGAYHVSTSKGDIIFLDTPGHEAFTAMRVRGAEITDLVVLVVAADDGVMEQTREAVNHARAANVTIMVAVNKIDKPSANIERIQRELAEIGLVPEEWGGDTIYNYVSAKTGQGIEELLEMIALQSEILDLKANPNKPARGRIIEAHLDKTKGSVATVLIQEGTLEQGDYFLSGITCGRVRAMVSDEGKKIKSAGPSTPVEIHGFDTVPSAGDEFIVMADEKVAKKIADSRAVKQRERELTKASKVTLEMFLATAKQEEGQVKTLNLIVKADVQGSLEAIAQALQKLSGDKVRIKILHSGTGAISESDILLASTAGAIVIGFNVRPIAKIRALADKEQVDIRFYDVIYKLSEDVEQAMRGMLAPVTREEYLGQAEVRQIFTLPKHGTVAGSFVIDGKLQRNAGVRLLRDGLVIYTGTIASLKRFKDDVREVTKGHECGFMLTNFNDIKVGDIAEAFELKEEVASL
ncbi:MAG: translation initiation factor IF-2, partial [Desulfovibrionaceae bacterium]|nr:translation initiation factor IF-2 [Desulfovibrionaceae bacterium]